MHCTAINMNLDLLKMKYLYMILGTWQFRSRRYQRGKNLLQLIKTSPKIHYVKSSWKRTFEDNFDKRYWILAFNF